MPTLVLASSNAGKLREIQQILAPLAWDVVPQSQYQIGDAEETGQTFVENALIKARHACALSGHAAIADDSGLAVDVLNGEPGIYSARYSGVDATDEQNVAKLLSALADVEDDRRQARFHCAMVMLRHANDPVPLIAQGSWEGRILKSPVGDNGFGYDPVFWVPTHQCSAAQLDSASKNQLSHRGQALRHLLEQLQAQLGH